MTKQQAGTEPLQRASGDNADTSEQQEQKLEKRRKTGTALVILGVVSCAGSFCLTYAVPTLTKIATGQPEPPSEGVASIVVRASMCIAFLLFLLGVVALLVGFLRILSSGRIVLFQPPPAVTTEPVQPSSQRAERVEGHAPAAEKTPLPDQPQALVELLGGFHEAGVRRTAAAKLGKIGQPAVGALIATLGHRDTDARAAAARILGRIGDPQAAKPLATKLIDEQKKAVRAEMSKALTKLGEPAVEPLCTVLKRRGSRYQWGAPAVVGLLGRLGDPRAVEPLIAALEDPGLSVRAQAVSALGRIGDPRAVGPLIAALGDELARPRATKWLVQFGQVAVGPLVATIKSEDEDDAVRQAAAKILKKIDHVAWDEVKDRVPVKERRRVRCLLTVRSGKAVQKMGKRRAARKGRYRHIIIIAETTDPSSAYKKAELALVQEIAAELDFSGRVNSFTHPDLPDPESEPSISGRVVMLQMELGYGPILEYDVEFCEKSGYSFMIAYM